MSNFLTLKSWRDFQEFSPEGFYNQLEEDERELERIPDKADITSYVKNKLGLVPAEEPRPDSPEEDQESVWTFLFSISLTLSLPRVLNSKLRGKSWVSFCKIVKNMFFFCQKCASPNSTAGDMPNEEDFEYIKLISNGAYGWEITLENKEIFTCTKSPSNRRKPQNNSLLR